MHGLNVGWIPGVTVTLTFLSGGGGVISALILLNSLVSRFSDRYIDSHGVVRVLDVSNVYRARPDRTFAKAIRPRR